MNNEMTTDNMSNEEVIDTLKGIVFNGFDRTTRKERQALDQAIKVLEQRPQGEWQTVEGYDGDEYYECSNCGEPWELIAGTPEENNMNFCPNCGADMRTKESEDV